MDRQKRFLRIKSQKAKIVFQKNVSVAACLLNSFQKQQMVKIYQSTEIHYFRV